MISDQTIKEFLNQEVTTIEVLDARAEIEVLSLEDEKEEDWITATKTDNLPTHERLAVLLCSLLS